MREIGGIWWEEACVFGVGGVVVGVEGGDLSRVVIVVIRLFGYAFILVFEGDD